MKVTTLTIAAIIVLSAFGCQKQNTAPTTQVQEWEPYEPEPLAQMESDPVLEDDPYATDRMAPAPAPRPAPVRTAAYETPAAPQPVRTYTPRPAPAPKPAPVVTPKPAPQPRTGPRTHVVAKGDSLYSLARKYYNDQRKWRDIWNANRAVISNPEKIYAGTTLTIP